MAWRPPQERSFVLRLGRVFNKWGITSRANVRLCYAWRMPKMSEAHLTARRDQILVAAMERFADGGFHATGMAEVIAASGLSAGAVYRYFASKEELIRAIVRERVLAPAAAAFGQAVDS